MLEINHNQHRHLHYRNLNLYTLLINLQLLHPPVRCTPLELFLPVMEMHLASPEVAILMGQYPARPFGKHLLKLLGARLVI